MTTLHPQVKDNPTVSSPEYVNVSPSDSVDLKYRGRRIMCAVAGNVSFQNEGAAIVLAIPANVPLDMQFDRINSTSTTATGLIAWF